MALGGLAGCATRTWNTRIKPVGAEDRYEFSTRSPHVPRDIFVVLAFSGGGARAAAFSYGVLEKLRDEQPALAEPSAMSTAEPTGVGRQ